MKIFNTLPIIAAISLLTIGEGQAQAPESAFNKDPWPAVTEGPIKVFILAGQSNMQGHASLRTLEHLIYNEETAADYEQWKDYMGGWNQRNDVWIWTTDGERSGSLKPGFGASEMKIGPELAFGWEVGSALNEQVLLIKTCWGGRSVRKDFLPPSAVQPSPEELQRELERMQNRNPNAKLSDVTEPYGKAYRDMIRHTQDILNDPKKYFPQYSAGRELQLAGLVWFQGWNDMVDGEQREEGYSKYTERLSQMILDVRKDLNAPDLPVVIGELGAANVGEFQAAQKAVAEQCQWNGKVSYVPTRQFWKPEVEKMVQDGVWKEKDWVSFYNVGSERGYHYLGSAEIYSKIGKAMSVSMLEQIQGN